MPSYAIHLAIAKEVIRKNKNNIKNEEEFILGSIKPDFRKGENIFHRGILEEYMRYGINTDYDKGYIFHLIVDDIFYFKEFKKECFGDGEINLNNYNSFYSDYDKIASILVKKYNIDKCPKEIKKYMQGEEGKLEYIKLEKLYGFIDKMSEIVLDDNFVELRDKLLL